VSGQHGSHDIQGELARLLSFLNPGGEPKLVASSHRYIMMHNANLDKSPLQRKSLPELRADLKKWEDQQRTNAKKKEKEKEKEGVGEDVIGYQACTLRTSHFLCLVG